MYVKLLAIVFVWFSLENSWADFFLYEQIPSALKEQFNAGVIEKSRRATAELLEKKDDDREVTICTGIWISNEGHLLTALHCIENHLEAAGIQQEEKSQLGITWYEISPEQRAPEEDTVLPRVLAKTNLGTVHSRPKIYFIGKGRASATPILAPFLKSIDPLETETRLLASLQQDFIILKFPVDIKRADDKENRGPICLELKEQFIRDDRPVMSLGYPDVTNRDTGPFNSNGRDLHFTFGRLVSSFGENHLKRALHLSAKQIENIDKVNIGSTHFLSTLDSYCGMSGSPVVDTAGNLKGMQFHTYCSSEQYLESSTLSLRTDLIYSQLAANKRTFGRPANHLSCK